MSQEACCDSSDFLRALSNKTRQHILLMIQEREMDVSEICTEFQWTQPTISYHLNILRKVDLVTTRRMGKRVVYRANRDCVAECCREILRRFPT